MKLFATLCTTIFCIGFASAQNVTIAQLSKFGEESIAVVQEGLTNSNWFFFTADDETDKKLGSAKFVFDKPHYKENESTGKYFITYYFSDILDVSAIDIIFKSNNLYTNFITQMETLSYKLMDSKTKDGNILKIYKSRGNIIVVTIPPNTDNVNAYKFLFTSNSSYRKLTD